MHRKTIKKTEFLTFLSVTFEDYTAISSNFILFYLISYTLFLAMAKELFTEHLPSGWADPVAAIM